MFAAFGAFTSSFCRTVESAQYGALPGFLFLYLISGVIIPLQAFPEPIPSISAWSPMVAVNNLMALSTGSNPANGAEISFVDSWAPATQPLAALSLWLLIFAYSARRYMRFNRR